MKLILTILVVILSALVAAADVPATDNQVPNDNILPSTFESFDATTDVFFHLYTRSNPTEPHFIYLHDEGRSLNNSYFNSNHSTRVITHGWNNDGTSEVNIVIRDAYLTKGDFNVIVVDWGRGSRTINYLQAKDRVPDVGVVTAQMIVHLETYTGISRTEVTMVGHSLGGNVAGFMGKALKIKGKPALGVIVGLDPANALYLALLSATRLANTDALYVQVIKTSSLSFSDIGTGNFYPNYGTAQPGCNGDINCNHGRSYHYFAESIGTPFVARHCDYLTQILLLACVQSGPSKNMGGEPVDTSAVGSYWMSTNSNSPYA